MRQGGAILPLQADVTKPEEARSEHVDAVEKTWGGPVNILVNNAWNHPRRFICSA